MPGKLPSVIQRQRVSGMALKHQIDRPRYLIRLRGEIFGPAREATSGAATRCTQRAQSPQAADGVAVHDGINVGQNKPISALARPVYNILQVETNRPIKGLSPFVARLSTQNNIHSSFLAIFSTIVARFYFDII